MKALLCRELGPPRTLVVADVPEPSCGDRDVRIAVRAAGVNFPDLLVIEGKYQFQPQLPFIPGGEVAGEVIEVGSAVTSLAVGDRVMALSGFNGFAEQIALPEDRCMQVPEGMDFETAAGFSMTYGTVIHALIDRGRLREGEWLLVHGASGGVGTAAIEVGRCLGAKIIATTGSDTKGERLSAAFGVDNIINLSQTAKWKDVVKRMTSGRGADVIFDPVGGAVFEQSLRCVAWNGRLLIVGFASGEIPSARANLLLLKGAAAVGVFWGSFVAREPGRNRAHFRTLFDWYAAGKLRPHISHRFPLADAALALEALAARQVVGKAIVTVG